MKTHNIKGKDVSEETIVEALKEHCSFEEQKEPRVDVYDFSACISDSNVGIWLGGDRLYSVNNPIIRERLKKLKRDTAFGFYTSNEIKKIIVGLQEMVDYLEKQ